MVADLASAAFVAAVVVKWAQDSSGRRDATPQQLVSTIERAALQVRSMSDFGDFPEELFDCDNDLNTVYNWLWWREIERLQDSASGGS